MAARSRISATEFPQNTTKPQLFGCHHHHKFIQPARSDGIIVLVWFWSGAFKLKKFNIFAKRQDYDELTVGIANGISDWRPHHRWGQVGCGR